MKNLFLGITLLLSSATFAAAPTYDELRGFVNDETGVAIDLLNRTLTKLNITSCSQLTSTRPDDETTIRVNYTEVGLYSEYTAHGPSGDNTWDGVVNNFSIRVAHETPSIESLALGLKKRIKLYTQTDYHDNATVSPNVAMILEFSCDMKKGHYFQTGSDNATTADLMEVYWDNTSTPVVTFKYAGPVRNTPVFYTRNSNDGKFSATVITTDTFAILSSLLSEFGINEYSLNVNTGVATMN